MNSRIFRFINVFQPVFFQKYPKVQNRPIFETCQRVSSGYAWGSRFFCDSCSRNTCRHTSAVCRTPGSCAAPSSFERYKSWNILDIWSPRRPIWPSWLSKASSDFLCTQGSILPRADPCCLSGPGFLRRWEGFLRSYHLGRQPESPMSRLQMKSFQRAFLLRMRYPAVLKSE